MLFIKKKKSSAICFIAMVLLLAFSGCAGGGSGPESGNVAIEITGAPRFSFYSLTVFEPGANVTVVPQSGVDTGLRGYEAQGFKMSIADFTISRIPEGDYVLVLGCANSMSGDNGVMYITSENGTSAKAVHLNFIDPVPFAEFNAESQLENIPGFFND